MWPQYRLNLPIFCVFGVGSQNFPLKNFSHEVDLGGVRTESLNFGGSTDGIGRKWGGPASGARRAPISYTPPLWVFMTPSLILLQDYFETSPSFFQDYFMSKSILAKYYCKDFFFCYIHYKFCLICQHHKKKFKNGKRMCNQIFKKLEFSVIVRHHKTV